jgi:four helix bundle protein
VEGFGRRGYKNDFLRYIVGAITECDETQVRLEMLFETKSLMDENKYNHLHSECQKLGRMINRFHSSVLNQHISSK